MQIQQNHKTDSVELQVRVGFSEKIQEEEKREIFIILRERSTNRIVHITELRKKENGREILLKNME